MKSIILTGGGTAGHIMPNLALIPELKKHFERIYYIAGDGMEQSIVKEVPLFKTTTIKFDRGNLLSNAKLPFALTKGVREAKSLLEKLEGGLVFSKGGYASLPCALGAKALGIPVIVHESDYSMGLANKIEAKFACRVLCAFPETKGAEFVGNPLRMELFHGKGENIVNNDDIKLSGKNVLLVFGGSSGAEFINKLIIDNFPDIKREWDVIHITGKKACNLPKADCYNTLPFTDHMEDYYAIADGVVMRGGANSLAEVTALGLPALVIPLPKGNSRGDQTENARSYAKRGLITMMRQENANSETLLGSLKYLKNLPRKTPNAQNTNEKIVEIIEEEFFKRY